MTVEDERQRVLGMNARVREEVGHRGVRSARDTWVMSNLVSTDEVIGPIKAPLVPDHFKVTCSKVALGQLHTLLGEIHAWATGLVGLGNIEADALYNGDPCQRGPWIKRTRHSGSNSRLDLDQRDPV